MSIKRKILQVEFFSWFPDNVSFTHSGKEIFIHSFIIYYQKRFFFNLFDLIVSFMQNAKNKFQNKIINRQLKFRENLFLF